jgi:hypothetical protein
MDPFQDPHRPSNASEYETRALPPRPARPPPNPDYDLTGYVEPLSQTNEFQNAGQHDRGAETGAVGAGMAAGYMLGQQEPKRYNRFFKTRRRMCLCICCGIFLLILAIMIPLVLLVIVPAVAQSAINASKMTITSAMISNPNEDGFTMHMAGAISNTGPFDAAIQFTGPAKMLADGVELGEVTLPPMQAKANVGAQLDTSAPFKVTNKQGFGNFAKKMMTSESFSWTISATASVQAMGLTLNGIKVIKDMPLKGMNNFPSVTIHAFDLPA